MGRAVALKWHDATIRELAAQGNNASAIAEALGASVAGVCRYLKVNGISADSGHRATPEQIERHQTMLLMYLGGLTYAEIGQEFGVTRQCVQQVLNRYGVSYLDSTRGEQIRVRNEARKVARRAALEKRVGARWGVSVDEWRQLRRDGTVRRYEQHRNNARSRGIPFLLSFPAWLGIWRDSGKYQLMGRGKGRYCMARNGDAGAYEVGNVSIVPTVQNSRDAVEQWRGKTKTHRGVFLLYPGRPNPYLAKVGGRRIGYFPTEEAAVAARAVHLAQAA